MLFNWKSTALSIPDVHGGDKHHSDMWTLLMNRPLIVWKTIKKKHYLSTKIQQKYFCMLTEITQPPHKKAK